MIVTTVLRTGGAYGPEHVRMLEEQLGGDVPLMVLTDHPVLLATRGDLARPLKHGWPGWWSKMELFSPDHAEDFLFFDLDTVIRARPSILDRPGKKPMILRDFYRPGGLQSSFMFIPNRFLKGYLWAHWMRSPERWMAEFGKHGLGDQSFIEHWTHDGWGILQDEFPGEYVSWKADALAGRPLPPEAKVIIFHGHPKPWDIPHEQQIWRH